jgi:uncharacterized membrane protein
MAMRTPSKTMPELTELPSRLFLWLSSGLALACLVLVLLAELTPLRSAGTQGWVEATLLLATTAATLAALTRELPRQNVLMAAVGIALIGGLAQVLGAATGMPFGPYVYTAAIGYAYQGVVAWPMPLIWVVILLNSRGVARLMLRPWRKLRNYGFWVIGLTVLLTVLFDLVLEPFAARVRNYWVWQPTKIPFAWAGTPVTNFLGWAVVALVIQAFVTPALIKRRPAPSKSVPDYHPLVIWLLAVGLFTAAATAHRLWLPSSAGALLLLAVSWFSLRGARW